jgi:hypothetical protein
MSLKGRWVQFTIRDIYFPGPDAALQELHGGDLLSGQIVDVSGNGGDPQAFVVVKVAGLRDPVVVAVDRVHESSDRSE